MAFTWKPPSIRVTSPWAHSKTGFLGIHLIIRNPQPLLFSTVHLKHTVLSFALTSIDGSPDPIMMSLRNTIIRNVILRRGMILLTYPFSPLPTLWLKQIGLTPVLPIEQLVPIHGVLTDNEDKDQAIKCYYPTQRIISSSLHE